MNGPSYANLLAVIQDVHAQHADDLCWMPADVNRIFEAAGLPPQDLHVGDKAAMLKNCERYVGALCAGGPWKSYAQLEAEIATLTKRLAENDTRLEEAIDISARARESHRFLCQGIKKALGLKNWPDFHQLYGSGMLAEGVVRFLDEQIAKHHGELARENASMRAELSNIKGEAERLAKAKCKHERLNEDGICRACGEDCRGTHS